MATGDFDGAETPKWNSLSTPIICTNAWMIRNNRWKWLNNGTANKDAGAPLMMVLDVNHPIFTGVTLDPDGLVDVLDPNAGSGHTSFLTDFLDPGNGKLLAQSLGKYNTAWIVEWAKGVEYYTGAVEKAGGPRLLFMAGTQDDPYTVSATDSNIMPVGVFNLNAAGQKMFLNVLHYLVPTPIALVNPSFEDPNAGKIKGWNGEGVAGTPAVDIPGWASDGAPADSGIESDTRYPASDGVWSGFLMSGDPMVYQLTNYTIKKGDIFTLKVDAKDNWAATTLLMIISYVDAGVQVPAGFEEKTPLTTPMQTFTMTFAADSVPECIGKKLGIEFANSTTVQSWMGFDNVRLSVMPTK
jgi:hypothetical protein